MILTTIATKQVVLPELIVPWDWIREANDWKRAKYEVIAGAGVPEQRLESPL